MQENRPDETGRERMSEMASYKKQCWEAADVRCPFYKKDSREERSIRCEGFEKGCLVESRFQSLPQRERHMGRYCVSRYEDCPVYKSTYDSKYREDEA